MPDELAPKRHQEEKGTPAYLPFRTFLAAFDVFAHGIPHKIDRSLWRTQAGSIQAQIMSALRFFQLIDEGDFPRPALERFVSNKDKREEYIGALLHHSYKHILDRDLMKLSPKLLSEEMDQFGLTGETKRKATVFFLQAVRFAGLPLHPLLQAQTRASSASVPRKRRKAQSATVKPKSGPPGKEAHEVPVSTNTQGDSKSVRLASGAVVTLTVSARWLELAADEREFVFKLIDQLQSSSSSLPKSDRGGA